MHDWFMNFFYYVKVHTYRIHRITRQIRPDLSGTGFTGIPVFFRYPVEPVAVPIPHATTELTIETQQRQQQQQQQKQESQQQTTKRWMLADLTSCGTTVK